jgi:hypothetical protein
MARAFPSSTAGRRARKTRLPAGAWEACKAGRFEFDPDRPLFGAVDAATEEDSPPVVLAHNVGPRRGGDGGAAGPTPGGKGIGGHMMTLPGLWLIRPGLVREVDR